MITKKFKFFNNDDPVIDLDEEDLNLVKDCVSYEFIETKQSKLKSILLKIDAYQDIADFDKLEPEFKIGSLHKNIHYFYGYIEAKKDENSDWILLFYNSDIVFEKNEHGMSYNDDYLSIIINHNPQVDEETILQTHENYIVGTKPLIVCNYDCYAFKLKNNTLFAVHIYK